MPLPLRNFEAHGGLHRIKHKSRFANAPTGHARGASIPETQQYEDEGRDVSERDALLNQHFNEQLWPLQEEMERMVVIKRNAEAAYEKAKAERWQSCWWRSS